MVNSKKRFSGKFHFPGWLVYAVLWFCIFSAPFINEFSLVARYEHEFDWGAILRSLKSSFPFFLLFLIHRLPIHYFLQRNRIGAYILSIMLMLFAFCGLRYITDKRDVQRAIAERQEIVGRRPPRIEDAPPPGGSRPMFRPGPFGLPSIVGMDILTAILLLGFDLGVVMLMKYQKDQEKEVQLDALRTQYELDHLRAQVNPHFLMNTLNNIHGMVEINPTKAQEMIVELSRMMRHVLYEGNKTHTTLQSEKLFITNYVHLMRERYPAGRVRIELRLPEEDLSGIRIPPQLFTNIIENAFKHGVSYRSLSYVVIRLDVQGGRVLLDCRNSIHPDDGEVKEKGGLGLTNLKQRLQLLYGTDYILAVENDGTKEYHVKLSIPAEYEENTLPRN